MEHLELTTYDTTVTPSTMTEWSVTHNVLRDVDGRGGFVDRYDVRRRTKTANIYVHDWSDWQHDAYEVPVTSTYVWTERDAVVGQNLLPLVLTLNTWGITHRIDQTGGFCMCLVVHTGDGGALVAGGDGDTFSYYPGNSWDGEDEPDDDTLTHYKASRAESRAAEFIVALYDRHGGPAGGTTKGS